MDFRFRFRSVQVRRSRGQQLQRHIRYIASRLHPASSVKVSRVQSTRLPTSTFVTVYRRRCSTTTVSRLLRQLDFRFRSRRTRPPVGGRAATVLHLPATSNCMYNRDVYGHLSSMFVDNTVTVPPSLMTATISGMTSYPSGQYTIGAPAFTIQPTPPVPAATVRCRRALL